MSMTLRPAATMLAPFPLPSSLSTGALSFGGGPYTVLEGEWPASRFVALTFPGIERARARYESAACQAILPVRQRHARTPVIVAAEFVASIDPPSGAAPT